MISLLILYYIIDFVIVVYKLKFHFLDFKEILLYHSTFGNEFAKTYERVMPGASQCFKLWIQAPILCLKGERFEIQ